MNRLSAVKHGWARYPNTTLASNATASFQVDTLGYNYLSLLISTNTTATNLSVTFATLKVFESDTATFATTNGVITGVTASGTTYAGEYVLPILNGATCSNTYATIKLDINLAGRKRYQFVQLQPHATTDAREIGIQYVLSKAKQAPATTTDMNVAGRKAV